MSFSPTIQVSKKQETEEKGLNLPPSPDGHSQPPPLHERDQPPSPENCSPNKGKLHYFNCKHGNIINEILKLSCSDNVNNVCVAKFLKQNCTPVLMKISKQLYVSDDLNSIVDASMPKPDELKLLNESMIKINNYLQKIKIHDDEHKETFEECLNSTNTNIQDIGNTFKNQKEAPFKSSTTETIIEEHKQCSDTSNINKAVKENANLKNKTSENKKHNKSNNIGKSANVKLLEKLPECKNHNNKISTDSKNQNNLLSSNNDKNVTENSSMGKEPITDSKTNEITNTSLVTSEDYPIKKKDDDRELNDLSKKECKQMSITDKKNANLILKNMTLDKDIDSSHINSIDTESFETFFCFIDPTNEASNSMNDPTATEIETYTTDTQNTQQYNQYRSERLANVHSTNTKLMESNLLNLKYLCEINKDLLLLMDQLGPKDKIAEIGKAKQRLKQIEEKINKDEEHLKEISILQNAFKQTLDSPEYGTEDKFDMEEASLSCNTFTDTEGRVTLDQFWKKLCHFSKQKRLSEKAVKNLLSSLLHGQAFEVYNDNKDKKLEDIKQILIDRFGEITTISDHVRSLENLTRGPNEKLASVMARCALLLDKTKYLTEEKHRDSRYEIEMKNKLFQLCKSNAKIAIERERNHALRAGYSLPYANLFNLALDAERNDIPTFY